MDFFIKHNDFRIFLPDVQFIDLTKSEQENDAYNSRQLKGVMSTSTRDRQGENVIAKGLDFGDFLKYGHFNDNHSQDTSAIVGYPEEAWFEHQIQTPRGTTEGWIARGYVLKGTKRADAVWELAKALAQTPNKRLGFSIEGKVLRRKNNVIEKAIVRNVAITNCPVNTDATWDVLAKSFYDEDLANKALAAGYGTTPATKTGGAAIGKESLEKIGDERGKKKKDAAKLIVRSLGWEPEEEIMKAIDTVLEFRPDFEVEAAAELVKHLLFKGVRR